MTIHTSQKGQTVIEQSTLPPEDQQMVLDLIQRQYPEDCLKAPAPFWVKLAAGIHPYHRANGYYCPTRNMILTYQHMAGADEDDVGMTLIHELGHWHQAKIQGVDFSTGGQNVHRAASWSRACWLATSNLWPELGMTYEQFRPYSSQRVEGRVVQTPREGALTDTQLHHWPRCLFE